MSIRMIHRCAPVLIVCVAALAAGCGGGGGGGTVDESAKAKLEEFGQALKTLSVDKQKPPAKQSDLNAIDPMLQASGPDLRSGELVYVWGAGYVTGGNASSTVIAYEKKAPTDGGWVLMQDGTVTHMSASEFNAAPKAGKK